VITIGIAGPDIADEVHPGKWVNTVGYQSNTGRCYTSHKLGANTDGQRFSVGKSNKAVYYYLHRLIKSFTSKYR
jgi:hypothetical protein